MCLQVSCTGIVVDVYYTTECPFTAGIVTTPSVGDDHVCDFLAQVLDL